MIHIPRLMRLGDLPEAFCSPFIQAHDKKRTGLKQKPPAGGLHQKGNPQNRESHRRGLNS